MGGSTDHEPTSEQKRMFEALWPKFRAVFMAGDGRGKPEGEPDWSALKTEALAASGLRALFNAATERSGDSARAAHEGFMRAVLFVIAGMIATLAVVAAAIIGSFSAALSVEAAHSQLFYRVFGDVMVWIVLVFFLGAVAALAIQWLRLLNKRGRNGRSWVLSLISVCVVAGLVFSPSYYAMRSAVCGALAFGIEDPPRLDADGNSVPIEADAIGKHATTWVGRLARGCECEAKRWFPLPHKESVKVE